VRPTGGDAACERVVNAPVHAIVTSTDLFAFGNEARGVGGFFLTLRIFVHVEDG
jgi:hypothetical protein